MIYNQIKTYILLSVLGGLLIAFGNYMGGSVGMTYALIFAGLFNLFAYFYSDKLVLKMYGAQPLPDEGRYKRVHDIVADLAHNAHMPMPALWLINSSNANAFATGRNPQHASVAVTSAILDLLDEHELRGVLAHELSHVTNRDILIGTVAATLATAIAYAADMLRWSLWFRSSNDRRNGSGLGFILMLIFAPIIATLIQLAISRSREYLADESGAHLSHDPLSLASALEKISGSPKMSGEESYARAATAHLFIANPFKGSSILNLLSTHPPIEERIKRLREMA